MMMIVVKTMMVVMKMKMTMIKIVKKLTRAPAIENVILIKQKRVMMIVVLHQPDTIDDE